MLPLWDEESEDAGLVFDLIRHGLHHYRALSWPVGLALGLGLPLASFLLGLAVVQFSRRVMLGKGNARGAVTHASLW